MLDLQRERLEGTFRVLPQAEVFNDELEVLRSHELKSALQAANKRLEADFRAMVERGHLTMSGVQTSPEREATRGPIPSEWILDYRIDTAQNVVEVESFRWVSVKASRVQSTEPSTAHTATRTPDVTSILQKDGVRNMSDEDILTVLEEHARRVVDDQTPLSPSAGVSLMPLIKRKLQHRAENGEMLPSIIGESEALERWIKDKAPSFHTPSAKPIENSIRSDYNRLKAQSKGIKA